MVQYISSHYNNLEQIKKFSCESDYSFAQIDKMYRAVFFYIRSEVNMRLEKLSTLYYYVLFIITKAML